MTLTNSFKSYLTQFAKKNFSKRKLLACALLIIAIIAAKELFFRHYSFAFNYSESLGGKFFFYEKNQDANFAVGDLVVFKVKADNDFYPNKEFLKIVAGKEGDQINIDDRHYEVNGYQATAKEFSRQNIRLNHFSPTSNVIPKNSFFVVGTHRDSYDSRYMGIIHRSQIIGKAWQIF